MRKSIVIFLCSIVPIIGFTQNEEVFPLENVNWKFSYNNNWGSPWVYDHYSCGEVTIDELTYTYIYAKYFEKPIGAVRVEGEKVYYHTLKEDATEQILIDYELEVGDSFEFVYPWATHTFAVIDVGYEEFEGIERKVISFEWQFDKWIRGIGSAVGNFRWWGENYGIWLNCMLKDGEPLYSLVSGTYNHCDSYVENYAQCYLTNTHEENNDLDLKIYPNPTVNQVIIDLNTPGSKSPWNLSIFNSSSKILNNFQVDNFPFEIDTRNYAKGFYLIKLENEKGEEIVKRFIVN